MLKKIIIIAFFAIPLFAHYPKWLQNSLKIIAEFKGDSGTRIYKEGYGLVINEGLVLTSASVVYDREKAFEITLYNTEALGEPIACVSHAKIIALDSNLDLALLSVERFTDIYCNTLPEPNFREIIFKKTFYNVLYEPLDLTLDERLEISYFLEHDWSQFFRERIAFNNFIQKSQEEKEKILGMPLFVEDEFLGLKVRENAENSTLGILTHRKILGFLCYLEEKTSVLKDRENIKNFCENKW